MDIGDSSPQHSHKDFTYPTLSSLTHGQVLLIIVIFFFSILLIITFLFFHLISRYGHHSANGAAALTSTPRAIALPVVSLGLDAATINSLPIFLHRSSATSNAAERFEEEGECSICLGLFEDDEMVKVLPDCLHAYHSECVNKWLRTRSSCPVCRSSLDSTSELITTE